MKLFNRALVVLLPALLPPFAAAQIQPGAFSHIIIIVQENRIYTPSTGIIWDAPEAIPEVCYGENDTTHVGSACGSVNGGTEWKDHITLYSLFQDAPIFSDIENCNLAQISWVIPDQNWSDHPFVNETGTPLGPAWVGDIINAIGNSYVNSGNKCDYWGTSGTTAAQPTAILVVWDDWGGFYDHVPPPNVWTGSGTAPNWVCPAPNSWGCGYTYGFRVPFLVASEYTGTLSNGNYTGYISGACGVTGQPACPNTNPIYQHDSGAFSRLLSTTSV
jgi:Phosphoesterase family